MSKRAEELAWKTWDFDSESGEWLEYRDAIAALIDTALVEERQECAKAYRARLELALAQLPEKHKRDPNDASYAEAIEDMIDMLGQEDTNSVDK